MRPMNNTSVSHRDHALRYLDAGRDLVDLIGSFHEERRTLGINDVDVHRGRELSQMIGEANGQLGFALKAAAVHAQLDVAEATRQATYAANWRSGYDVSEVVTLAGELQ